jgi:hypothetical protein
MRTLSAFSVALSVAALAGACGTTEFASPDLVEKHRVLAGSVILEGDEARVTPAPGERASYVLLVGGRGPRASWSYMLAVCRFVRDANGAPSCDPALPPVALSGSEPSVTMASELPHVDFQVPAAEMLRADEDALLVQGLVCPVGPFDDTLLAALGRMDYAQLAAGRNPCADKSKNGVVLASILPIERNLAGRNHAPQIEHVSYSQLQTDESGEGWLSANAWTYTAPPEAPQEGCMGQGLVEVQQGTRIGIQVQLDDAARESYEDPSPIPGEAPRQRVEIPQVQGLATAGRFEIVRDNQLEAGQELRLEWTLPKQAKIPANGLLVRFWLLATDDRFGDTQAVSWAERALCVLR